MLKQLPTAYRDYGFLALGFSIVPLIEIVSRLSRHPMTLHSPAALYLLCGIATGPLLVVSLLARTSWIHRAFLLLGAAALVAYVVMLAHR